MNDEETRVPLREGHQPRPESDEVIRKGYQPQASDGEQERGEPPSGGSSVTPPEEGARPSE